MTPQELMNEINSARAEGLDSINLVTQSKKLAGFPRGEFVCETERGVMRRYDIDKLEKFIKKYI